MSMHWLCSICLDFLNSDTLSFNDLQPYVTDPLHRLHKAEGISYVRHNQFFDIIIREGDTNRQFHRSAQKEAHKSAKPRAESGICFATGNQFAGNSACKRTHKDSHRQEKQSNQQSDYRSDSACTTSSPFLGSPRRKNIIGNSDNSRNNGCYQ